MPIQTIRSPILREIFEPTNVKHIESMDNYLKTGRWGEVQFFCELPFDQVPATVLTKYARHVRNLPQPKTEIIKVLSASV